MKYLLYPSQPSLNAVPSLNPDIMFKEVPYLNPDIIFNCAPISMVIFDKNGKIIKANPYLEQQFHYISGELTGAPIELLFPLLFEADNKRNIYSLDNEFNNMQMGKRLKLNAHARDGSPLPVEINLVNYETLEGKFIIAFINNLPKEKERQPLMQSGTKSDYKTEEVLPALTHKISQLEELVLKMKIKDKQLNRINGFLNNIWEHVNIIIFITDLSGTIKMFNPTAEKKLGYESNEIINKTTPALFLQESNSHIPNNTDRTSQKAMWDFSILTSKADLNLFNEQEVTYVCKDRSTFTALLTLTPMKDENGVTNGYLAIALDISKNKKAEREWKLSLQKEKELSDLKSNFISIASHEFRTPLSTVLSSAYLISKYSELQDFRNIDKHVVRIVSSVNILTSILNDFLSVGKIEEGKIQVRPTIFNLEQHMLKIIHELNGLLKKGQTVIYSHSGDTAVLLDPILFKHIIINLFSNAIKFSPENSTIELVTAKTDQTINIKVKDEGIGISLEDQSKLSQRFFRGGNVTNIQGTGLGLNIVSKYIELMEGKIKCESKLNQGTTFTVIFNINNTNKEI